MAVVEPVGEEWQDLRAALGEPWGRAPLRVGGWEARVAEGQPVVRVLLGERWWELHLKGSWSGGQKAAFETLASGAAAGELFFYRGPSGGDPNAPSGVMCRMVAWLPREQAEDSDRPQDPLPVPAGQLDPDGSPLDRVDIRFLRGAIRANRVTFPSQVPTFPKHDRPDLQRKLAQLYFVLGWNSSIIGERYGLSPARVRQILNTWRRRAVEAGYLHHIPPAETIGERAIAVRNLAPQFAYAANSRAMGTSRAISLAVSGVDAMRPQLPA